MASKKRAPKSKHHHILICRGVTGLCIYLNGYRIVGEKPWGGGKTVREWTFSDADMKTAIKMAERYVGKQGEKP